MLMKRNVRAAGNCRLLREENKSPENKATNSNVHSCCHKTISKGFFPPGKCKKLSSKTNDGGGQLPFPWKRSKPTEQAARPLLVLPEDSLPPERFLF